MSPIPLSGYTLPVAATRGLMDSAIDVLGISGAAPALLKFMLQDAYPESDIVTLPNEMCGLLNPLYPYYRQEYGLPSAVDYVFLQQFRHKLDIMYSVKGGRGLARRIGRLWWCGEPPIYQSRPHTHTLCYQLSPRIREALLNSRANSLTNQPLLPGQHPAARHDTYRLWIACQSFAETLHQYSGISCSVETQSTSVVISVSHCPFCANQLLSCALMLGVVEGFLEWLYQMPNKTERLSSSLIKDDTHHIQMTVSRPPLHLPS